MSRIILDAGPLVAWFCPRDMHHRWAVEVFQTLGSGCLLCEAVLAEVCHLAAKEGVARDTVLGEVERGGMVVMPMAGEIAALRVLLQQYRDIDMDFGDACVVRLAELRQGATVCTTDSDFKVYRRHGRQVIPLLAPWE
jgi:predicted nucleic acid-binding protein